MEMILDGAWVTRDETTPVRDPGTGEVIDTVPRASADDMRRAVGVAARAAAGAPPPAHERIRVLDGAARALEREGEAFARTIAREGIKTIREARKEVARCVETLRISAEEARRIEGATVPFDQMPGAENRLGFWQPAPVGVVGCITPFNDPLNLVAHKVGPALAAGNAVIVKPDSRTPLSALGLARLLLEAGAPPERLQVVTGPGGEVGGALVEDPRVRMISFTGGRATGEAIARRAGLKKIAMELGSNAPALVFADADLDLALESTLSGAYWAAGQNCLHVQRIFVQEDAFDAFAERFAAGAAALRVGDKLDEATDMGPMIDEEAAERVVRVVRDAVGAGGRLLHGGEREGPFVRPTVVAEAPEESELASEEVYGPATVLYRFRTLDEAVARANAVDYGLQAGVFTRDLDTAFAAARGLVYGGVMINDSSDYRIDAMPFGGFKGSGLGREGVRFAVHEMTEPKLVCLNLQTPSPRASDRQA